jgi:hypothetical protein
MPKETELREGEEAAERFKELTAKVMTTPKSAIDKRVAKERAKRDRAETEQASE